MYVWDDESIWESSLSLSRLLGFAVLVNGIKMVILFRVGACASLATNLFDGILQPQIQGSSLTESDLTFS
jgi:hypothetical protein